MKQLNLALSGSGALLVVYVGILKACERAGRLPRIIAGTSGGSITAVLYAALRERGKTADDLEQLILNADWISMMDFRKWSNIIRVFTRHAVCNPRPLENFLYTNTHYLRFRDLTETDLRLTAYDCVHEKLKIFSRETTPNVLLADAARASSSLPFVYPVKKLGTQEYMDGGIMRNLPANLLPNDGSDSYCIVLKNQGTPTNYNMNFYREASAAVNGLMAGQELLDRTSAPWVDFVTIDTGYYDALDASMSMRAKRWLIQQGTKAMTEALVA